MSENEYLCPDCGKPMTLAPGVDYFCQTPACSEKMFDAFAKGVRNYAVRRERAPKPRVTYAGGESVEDLSRKLEEARGRIADLEQELDREKKLHHQANTMRIQQMDRDNTVIESLKAALVRARNDPGEKSE